MMSTCTCQTLTFIITANVVYIVDKSTKKENGRERDRERGEREEEIDVGRGKER